MQNEAICLIPADVSLTAQVADFYTRNRAFLAPYKPARTEKFFTPAYQRTLLLQEMRARRERTAFRFYITPAGQPDRIIGAIGLSNIVWGAFCSAFLGYKLDEALQGRGYMTAPVAMVTEYAFQTLHLHRIEANVMPRSKASLRILEKNGFYPEGLAKKYLKINGIWEDHIHMVKLATTPHQKSPPSL